MILYRIILWPKNATMLRETKRSYPCTSRPPKRCGLRKTPNICFYKQHTGDSAFLNSWCYMSLRDLPAVLSASLVAHACRWCSYIPPLAWRRSYSGWAASRTGPGEGTGPHLVLDSSTSSPARHNVWVQKFCFWRKLRKEPRIHVDARKEYNKDKKQSKGLALGHYVPHELMVMGGLFCRCRLA